MRKPKILAELGAAFAGHAHPRNRRDPKTRAYELRYIPGGTRISGPLLYLLDHDTQRSIEFHAQRMESPEPAEGVRHPAESIEQTAARHLQEFASLLAKLGITPRSQRAAGRKLRAEYW